MEYSITGTVVPNVELTLKRGESAYTQSGSMFYHTDGISMKTNAKGGVFKGIGRMFSGESLFIATYTATKDDAKVAFASTVPGSVIALDVSDNNYTIQKGAFLAAESTVTLSTVVSTKIGRSIFGGEGFILQKLKGTGKAFIEIDGDSVIKDLKAGESIKVQTGNLVAFSEGVKYDIETVKGLGNVLFSGEGLFLTKLTGPGRVVLQTMNISDFASRVSEHMPIQQTTSRGDF